PSWPPPTCPPPSGSLCSTWPPSYAWWWCRCSPPCCSCLWGCRRGSTAPWCSCPPCPRRAPPASLPSAPAGTPPQRCSSSPCPPCCPLPRCPCLPSWPRPSAVSEPGEQPAVHRLQHPVHPPGRLAHQQGGGHGALPHAGDVPQEEQGEDAGGEHQ